MKLCPNCKTYAEFSKSGYTRDKLQVYCKKCMKEKTEKYREKGLIGRLKKFYGGYLRPTEEKQVIDNFKNNVWIKIIQ